MVKVYMEGNCKTMTRLWFICHFFWQNPPSFLLLETWK